MITTYHVMVTVCAGIDHRNGGLAYEERKVNDSVNLDVAMHIANNYATGKCAVQWLDERVLNPRTFRIAHAVSVRLVEVA